MRVSHGMKSLCVGASMVLAGILLYPSILMGYAGGGNGVPPCTGKIPAIVDNPCGEAGDCNAQAPCGSWFNAFAGPYTICTGQGAKRTDHCVVLMGEENLVPCGMGGLCFEEPNMGCARGPGFLKYTRKINPDAGACVVGNAPKLAN